MVGNSVYSPADQSLSANPNLCDTMEEVSQNSSEQLVGEEDLEIDLEDDCDGLLDIASNDEIRSETFAAPAPGMEFDSYDDAYSYYSSYARELGFSIRVKSSWTKRNSKEKRGAVLCCNCEGFKIWLKKPIAAEMLQEMNKLG